MSHAIQVYRQPSPFRSLSHSALQSLDHTDPGDSNDTHGHTDTATASSDLLSSQGNLPRGISVCPLCSQAVSQAVPIVPPATGTVSQPNNGYFKALEEVHEESRPPSPHAGSSGQICSMPEENRASSTEPETEEQFIGQPDLPSKGYYERFFKEKGKLGMGAEGSVFLAEHVIGDDIIGTYAVKKIAVGRSKAYLHKMLQEVRVLEALRHPNIISYHHAWIDVTRFSSFGPPVTALHVLMMYATAGNLDHYLAARAYQGQGRRDRPPSKEERIKEFRDRQWASLKGQNMSQTGVRTATAQSGDNPLLMYHEILCLFEDIVEGLCFLHGHSIVHLDMKCSNVLLHWEDNRSIPKAMISDFGTSKELRENRSAERTGHTGTMEYMAPETLLPDGTGRYRPSDTCADMWSMGIILYKLIFLKLPYPETMDFAHLQRVILAYPG
ncbi:hypothetical protein IAT38_006118 [Cryptococcus sp. DSM 104549]